MEVPQDDIIKLCRELSAQRRLIIVSNRGPIEYHIADDGRLKPSRGQGGMVTALSALSQYVEFTWIAAAMGEGDRRVGERAKKGHFWAPLPGQKLDLRFVTLPKMVYHNYYNVFCNPYLWFLQHYMWDTLHSPNVNGVVHDAWEHGYVPANRAFAEAVIAEAKDDRCPPIIMLQDYHLYLVDGYLRREVPGLILEHFIHIPWPDSRYWQLVPSVMSRAILDSLCAADIIGLQTEHDVHNFLHTCECLLDGAGVDDRSHTINLDARLTRVVSYPISVDVGELKRLAWSPEVQGYEQKLRPYFGEQTIVRVDRAEPTKNIIRGLEAFDILLQRYPQLRGKVKLISFLVPSRTQVMEYQRYTREIMASVTAINAKYSTLWWQPIKVFYENNYPQAIAGMRHYDVLLVNPVVDGMNLVAKEGPIVNTRNGVLILSEAAGAHEQLGASALSVAPADIEGTVQALYAALTMDAEERKRRAQALRQSIEAEDITEWFYRQFEDIRELARKQLSEAR